MHPSEQTIRDAVAEQREIKFALLFGSRANGSARPDSDWDLALFIDPAIDAERRWQITARLIAALAPAIRVDVTNLNEAPPLLAHRALCGRVFLNRDPVAYSRFFVRTLAEAGDERYWNDLHARERDKRLAGGRFGRP